VRTEAVNPLLRGRSDTQVAADQEAAAQALFELDEDGFLQRLTRGRQPRAAFRDVGHQG